MYIYTSTGFKKFELVVHKNKRTLTRLAQLIYQAYVLVCTGADDMITLSTIFHIFFAIITVVGHHSSNGSIWALRLKIIDSLADADPQFDPSKLKVIYGRGHFVMKGATDEELDSPNP